MNLGFQIETLPDWEYLVISDFWKKKCADLRIKTGSLTLDVEVEKCVVFGHTWCSNFSSKKFEREKKITYV